MTSKRVDNSQNAAGAVPFGARMPGLDGLRGIAILGVISFHTLRLEGPLVGPILLWRTVQESTWAGVDLFFVLSGFLITGILLDSRECTGYFRNFYGRRTLRIMPLYYGTLVFALLVLPAIVGSARLPEMYIRLREHQLWLWTYLQNYLQAKGPHQLPGLGHFWSLAVEEQFYWIWPIVVFLLCRRSLYIVCLLVCGGEPLFRAFLLSSGLTTWAVRQYTFTRLDTLLFGALVALVVRDRIPPKAIKVTAFIGAMLCLAVLATICLRYGFIPYEAPETEIIGYSALAMLFSIIVYLVVSHQRLLYPVFSLGGLRWLGRYSYAIYIFHVPLNVAYQQTIARHVPPMSQLSSAVLCFLIVTAVSGGLARISWVLFESQFLRLKRHFDYAQSQVHESHLAAAAS